VYFHSAVGEVEERKSQSGCLSLLPEILPIFLLLILSFSSSLALNMTTKVLLGTSCSLLTGRPTLGYEQPFGTAIPPRHSSPFSQGRRVLHLRTWYPQHVPVEHRHFRGGCHATFPDLQRVRNSFFWNPLRAAASNGQSHTTEFPWVLQLLCEPWWLGCSTYQGIEIMMSLKANCTSPPVWMPV
jgi:hypothetical protein